MTSQALAIAPADIESSVARTEVELKQVLAQFLGCKPEEIPSQVTFLDMGVDSLGLLTASQAIREKMGVRIPFRMLLDEYPTITAVAGYIDQQRPAKPDNVIDAPLEITVSAESVEAVEVGETKMEVVHEDVREALDSIVPVSESLPVNGHGASSVEEILARQIDLMRMQLELLLPGKGSQVQPAGQVRIPAATNGKVESKAEPKPTQVALPAPRLPEQAPAARPESDFVAHEALNLPTGELDPQQQQHLADLIARLTKRTARSKALTQKYRKVLADNRVSAGFRKTWKELIYQILVDRAQGCKIWDVDGNEYIDITMGYGAIIFGHSPDFMMGPLAKQVELGIGLGPQSHLAGEVAELLCKLTGCERAAFCNSGTEAVMSALRLARTYTGRTRIALFTGSYHGTFDGVMVRGQKGPDGELKALPLAPGIPQSMIDDVLLLRYANPASLETLKKHVSSLAAVLVAPVPSRDPEGYNQQFLVKLREITEQAGTALIFDEVVTGFRVHPGGAQALFNVRADLVTYGKAVGGGLPIGVVAGKAIYMDGIDGGDWSFGDNSYPKAETTFFAGTFFKHPWVMTSTLAILREIERRGQELYDSLATTTRNFASEMNKFFQENDLPFELVAYGSFFMVNPQKEVKHSDLFYYYLLERGIYIWEGHSCFFSTAHTPEDVEKVARAIRESALEMRKGGFVRPARGGPSPDRPQAGEQATKDEAQVKPQSPRKLRLTEEQRNLLAHSQTGDESSRAYNEVLCLHLRGKLSLDALRKSLQQLVDRHDALRITIDPDGESANIHEHVPIVFRVEYIQQSSTEEQNANLSAWVQRQMKETFDLQQGPLVRAGLARLSEQHHVLTLVMHHIAVDGWSFGILLNELGPLYSAHAEGRSPSLPAPVSLVSPAEPGTQQHDLAEMEESEAFWKQTFAGGVPVLQLPTDHPRPPVLSFRGAGVRNVLDNTIHDGAAAAARKCNATLFATLLSTYAVLLHRLAGQEEIVIGVPIAGQASSGNRNAVGYNVQLAPVRSVLDPSAKFSEFVAQTGRALMDSLEHARVPLNRLVKVLNIRRNPNRLPLMPVAFNMDKAAPTRSWAGLECELVVPESDIAKFDLEISVEESAGQLKAQLQYSTDLFEPAGAQMILTQWQQVLKGVIANPECRISELTLLTEAERNRILVEWNSTRVEYPRRCVHEMFEEQVAKTPSAVAVCYQDQKLTYAELDQRANQLARYLQKLDVKPEVRVGICVGRSLEMMIGLLGIMKSGGAYVPLDPSYPPERLAYMVADAEVGIVLTQERLLSKLAAGHATDSGQRPPVAVCLDTQWEKIAREPGTRPVSHVTPDNLAYIYYTSGSTGKPKGVALAHYAIANYFWWGIDGYGAAGGHGAAVHSSIAVDLTLTNFLPLFVGGRVMLAEETPGVDGLVKLLKGEPGFSLLKITPTHLTLLNPQLTAREKAAATRRLVIGADNLVAEPTLPWRDEAPEVELLNEYGPTETVVGCSIYRMDESSARNGGVPIGKPIANITMYVLDAGGQPVPVGMPGELYIGGIGVARGYWKRPELTAEKFVPDEFAGCAGARFYRTGDRARFLPNGNLEFLGRLDHQVKIRGYRIEPGEIEAVLSGCPGVQKTMVVVRKDTGDKRLVAYVAAPGKSVRESELRQYLRERLPDYMVPAAFVIMESLPVGSTGKIDPKDLPRPEMEGDEANYVEPRTDAEKALARIWAQVLGVERVGVNDNFFELGGDSILALQISSRAIAEGIKVTNQIMFQHQTVAEVLAAVQERETAVAPSVESESWPLTPIQSWFFERDIPDRNHWNQSVMLQTPAKMDTNALSRALVAVVRQHAALGVRFSQTTKGIAMVPGVPESTDLLEVVDLSGVPQEELAATLTQHANRIQRSLNLQAGPLCRFAYFSTGENSPARFFAVIHHLVVDVVSWRILLRDLETTYSQVVTGKDPELMAPSTPYPEWGRRLKEYAGGPEISSELSFWLKEERYKTKPLPVDSSVTVTRRSSQRLLEETLDREQTEILLRGAPRKLRSPISEVLLAALAITLARWTENPFSLVDIEGHGREELFPDVDLTRTVGWFTTVFPVLLHGQPQDFKATLEAVRREFRGVPQGGIGYGILRHLHPDASVREQLRQVPSSEICFNYLGQFDTVLEKAGPFQSAGESGGDSQPPEAPQSHLLSLDVSIMGGRLRHVWMYDTEAHREETIRRVASWFSQALRDAIAACQLV